MLKRIILTTAWLIGGCSHQRIAEFGIISPEITNITTKQLEKAKITTNVSGTDTAKIYLIFPTGTPTIENAVQKALQQHDADILTEVKVTQIQKWYILYGYNSIEVRGNAIQLAPMIEGTFNND